MFILSQLALDYVGIDDIFHGKRVSFLSHLIAKEIGYSEEDINDIIFEGLLHDCGVSSTVTHAKLINELDWENSHEHCVRGSKLLIDTPIFKKYAPTIFYHHTHCNELPKKTDISIRERANITYLADRIDILIATGRTVDEVLKILEGNRNTLFYTNLIDAFLKVLQKSDPVNIIKDKDRVEIFFEKGKEEIPLLARIVAVADIFQALAQNRPYRKGLEPKIIMKILKDMAEHNKIDGAVLYIVDRNLDSCYKKALPEIKSSMV
ncbi:HD-GYP domain-containing protein [Thiovulum sp. ES]|nr:HD-GYP domain-containing protein [Thiovulum sp. ES]